MPVAFGYLVLFSAAPPTIMPFLFPNNLLSEGMRSAVSCQILQGNLPINFSWDKDGQPVGQSYPGKIKLIF